MSLQRCKREHTHREYQVWTQWLDERWNVPSLTDHYLMQVAAEVRRVLSKDPAKILTNHFQLSFTRKKAGEKKIITDKDIEELTASSKSMWGSFLNLFKKSEDGSGN